MNTDSGRITFTVNGKDLRTADNMQNDGFSFISANNSSRLLLDYKSEHPESYRKLLEFCFGKNGLGLNYFKLEMGSDVNSTSGTEPCVKRSEEEPANVRRGAGPQLAADALAVNPELQIDMEYWGIPAWVIAASDYYGAMYRWYKETVDALFDTYGIRLSYLTANQNERDADTGFIKYLRAHLDTENDRYPYKTIRLVAGEGDSHWGLADELLSDRELRDAISVFSAHYTSETNEKVRRLQNEFGKKIWFSEGSSPMTTGSLVRFHDGNGSGISGINGTLDILTRMIKSAANGMTMYEFQPVVSAYYNGATFCSKQLITADTPWNGSISLDDGFYMAMHVIPFFPRGWYPANGAIFGDGVPGGDGHAIVNSCISYMTMVSPDRKDCSILLCNPTGESLDYRITVCGLPDITEFYAVETKGPNSKLSDYREHFFKTCGSLPVTDGTVSLLLSPYSIVTLSTLSVPALPTDYLSENAVLPLPYEDDFSYRDYPSDYLKNRGGAPRYTTDIGGAFEVSETSFGNVLMQRITPGLRGKEWGATPDPVTTLGDDRWSNYEAETEVHFPAHTADGSYAGLGVRYTLAADSESGYAVRLYANGRCELRKNRSVLSETVLPAFDASHWHTLTLRAERNKISGFIDGAQLFFFTECAGAPMSGRISLASSYDTVSFRKLSVRPLRGVPYRISRTDAFDPSFRYEGNWEMIAASGFRFRNRTEARGTAGASVTVTFTGSECSLTGPCDAGIGILLDGTRILKNRQVKSGNRESIVSVSGLSGGTHTITLTVHSGSLSLDVIEYA